jgi:hypothetical protein
VPKPNSRAERGDRARGEVLQAMAKMDRYPRDGHDCNATTHTQHLPPAINQQDLH